MIKTVSDASLNGDGRKRLAELQRHFAELVQSYQKSPDAFAVPAVGGESDDDDDDARADANWKELFTLVERDLTGILGAGGALPGGLPANASPAIAVTTGAARGGAIAGTTGQLPQGSTAGGATGSPATPSPSPSADPGSAPQSAVTPGSPATPDAQAVPTTPTAGATVTSPTTATGAVATTGAAPSIGTINGGLVAGAIGVKNLDPEVRRQLEEFRLHVELFFAATTMNLEGETAR